MRVTLAQIAASTDRVANLSALRDAATRAAADNADILVLPEYASAYDPRGVGIDLAEPLDGDYVRQMSVLAAQHRIWIIAGIVTLDERSAAAALARNVVIAMDPTGSIAGAYDKVHLYDAFGARESDRLQPGDPQAPAVVVPILGTNVGIMTCYDLRFPESARRLVDAGAHVIVVPAAWADGALKTAQWELLIRARALENVSVVVGVGMAGPGVIGHSVVATADGMTALTLDATPQIETIEIDLDAIAATRAVNPSLANRRYTVVPGAQQP